MSKKTVMQTAGKQLARFVLTMELVLHASCFPAVCMTVC